VVASHLNGFVDPVLLVAAMGRLPRFLAKATLWRVLPARPFLALACIIPVHRRQDTDGTAANTATFAAAVEALAAGATVALFPEGTTHDRPHLVELRTGVARIALQAIDSGVADLRIVPVGIAYEDKVALRGRALVAFGEPIAAAADVARFRGEADDDRGVVRGLTRAVEQRLRAVSPDFRSSVEALALIGAAELVVRDQAEHPRKPVRLAEVDPVARDVARAAPPGRRRVVDAMARYQLVLAHVGVHDEDVVRSVDPRTLGRRVAVLAVVVVVLAPFAVAGALANAVPTAFVVAAGLVPQAPVTKGTVRVLVALVAFPLTWLALAWFDLGGDAIADVTTAVTFPLTPLLGVLGGSRSGFLPSLAVFVAVPLLGVAALAVVVEWGEFRRTWRSWRTVLDRRGQIDELRALRRTVVEQMAAARGLDAPPAGPGTATAGRDAAIGSDDPGGGARNPPHPPPAEEPV
jgi:glycerol-3-phosphate O-acyltransferase/dihydroxyacetone phosphate acyltransferase